MCCRHTPYSPIAISSVNIPHCLGELGEFTKRPHAPCTSDGRFNLRTVVTTSSLVSEHIGINKQIIKGSEKKGDTQPTISVHLAHGLGPVFFSSF